jgi:RNA polymerase sigma-70 factor (ECF subfamily)
VDDEAAVLGYLQTRDPELFRVLVERHQARVFRLVAGLLGPHADLEAHEVTQDVFLRACAKLETFRGESRFAAWLYRLAYHRAIEHRRGARFRFQHVSLGDRELASSSPEAEAARQQLVAHLLEGLPDTYRSVINLHYWLDCSVEEIAELLCVAPGTVKSYLFRARQILRAQAALQGIELSE